MIAAVLQALLCSLAVCAVFGLWRRVVSCSSRAVFWLITIGVLVRAVGGELAFWISYLHLPIVRSLQIGRGLWIFAIDAIGYFDVAAAIASRGPLAILFADRTLGSVFYVQVLAAALLLFGTVTSVAILLNIAAYLGTCWMVMKLAGSPMAPNRAVVFAIAIVSLAPSMIVWALQPLKDTIFLFLVAAFFVAAIEWQKAWTHSGQGRRPAMLAATATVLLAALMYSLSAIRWYVGLTLFVASIVFLLLVVAGAKRRAWAALNAAVLICLFGVAFFVGAGPYAPAPIRRAVLGRSLEESIAVPGQMVTTLHEVRDAFDQTASATKIASGPVLRKIDHALGSEEKTVSASHPDDSYYRKAPPGSLVVSITSPPVPMTRNGEISLPAETAVVPGSASVRVILGFTALLIPRAVAQPLGLVRVGGGRGLWLLPEMDTIVFDIALVFALVSIVRSARKSGLRAPVFWMLFIVTGTLAFFLAYTVSNFGTLFRLRDMVLIGLALLPVAASTFAMTSHTYEPASSLEGDEPIAVMRA